MARNQGPSGADLRRHHKRVRAMLDDPACVDDLLLVGLGLTCLIDFDRPPRLMAKHFRAVAGQVFPANTYGRGAYAQLLQVLKADIRRYDADEDPDSGAARYWSIACSAPMIRRAGTCGQHATVRVDVADHDTGRRKFIGACSRPEHRTWLKKVAHRNDLAGTPPPTPAANTGGVLARHFPEVAWQKLWSWLDPKWTPPPEDAPWRRPTLSLYLGDADRPTGDVDPTPEPSRPTLAVVPGAGEGIRIDAEQP